MYFLIHRGVATKNNNTKRLKDFSIENILKLDTETSPILGKIDG